MNPLTQKSFDELKASMKETHILLGKSIAHHRELKIKILRLAETNYTKDRLKEELFKIYMEMK